MMDIDKDDDLKMDELKEGLVAAENRAELDPLLISHVLDQTFRNCSIEDLKSFRLVSKFWNNTATSILQERTNPISFRDESFDSVKMLKVVSVFNGSVNPPYVKFEIASNFFTLENNNPINRFFQVCGPFMEYLMIYTVRMKESQFKFAKEVLKNLHLPRLKALVFEDHTPQEVAETQHNSDFTTFFKAFLKASSKLERLDLSFPKRFYEPDGNEIIPHQIPQLPDGIICSRIAGQLKHLEISANITDSQMICLSLSGLQLRTLHFRVRNVSLQESSFKALLESQSETLEELKLTEEHLGSDFLVKFPRMSKLKSITIVSICEFENSSITFAPFGYQDKLPNIQSINLWNCFGKETRWNQFFLAQSPSLSLCRLELPTQFRNPSLAMNISSVFPYLKKLKIGFSLRPENWVVMKTVFETLISLEELDIRTDMDNQNENIDHVLTGYSKEVCRRIREEGLYDPAYFVGVERLPSLINLINLRKLEIVLDNNRAPFITDVTGYLGFMQMPKLQVLRFTRYGMSQVCSEALAKKFRIGFIPPHGRNFFEMEYLNMDFD